MPASSGDVIGGALDSVYRRPPTHSASPSPHTKTHNNRQIHDQLFVASKQVLVHTVEYERAGPQHSTVLGALRTKYVNLSQEGEGEESDSTQPTMAHAALPHPASPHKPQGGGARPEDQLDEPRVTLWPREKVTLGWRKTFPPGAGMYNLGNTCYLNSSLQALFHIPSLANWLMEDHNNHTQRCQAMPTAASFCSLCAMMRTLRLALDRTNTVIKPTHIHHKLKSIGKTLVYGRQEDAHEFIKLLLDHMEKSYLAFRRAGKLDHRSRETTPLNQIFGGYIRQQVICPVCRYVSTTFSHFQDLVLDIRNVGSVDEALNLHFRKETLDTDNAYKCERCRKKVPATKRHLIERAPHVLLIQLKRFTMSGGKIGKHINIQRTIDISRFVNGANKPQGVGGKQGGLMGGKQGGGMGGGKQGGGMGAATGGQYQYRLSSMVIHLGGSQHGGHYTAIGEASSGTMFEFDDTSVRPISLQSALMRNPYILFYEMIRKPKDPMHAKAVIRQSSEKALIRQNSDGILKPIPTSHSASSVANGFGHATDNIGESGGNRATTHINNSKPPLPAQKERERISFGLKFGSKGDGAGNKPNKIILNSSTTSLLGSKSSSTPTVSKPSSSSTPTASKSSSSTLPSKSSSSSIPTTSKSSSSSTPTTPKPSSSVPGKAIGPQRSSLVPYLDDSEESEVDDRAMVKPSKDKSVPNCKAKTDDQKSAKVNGVKCGKNDRVNGSLHVQTSERMSNGDAKSGDCEGSTKSNGVAVKAGSSSSGSPFLPRSLHVATITNAGQVTNSNGIKGNNKCGDSGWTVTDASLHSPSECSSGSGGSHNNVFTVVEQPTTTCKLNQRIEQSKAQEKPENQGWIVTIRKHRPELEKAHSVDCVLPMTSHRKDEADSASLKSKASVDSGRSDHSTKSVKKSFFSLFTCVSSSRSPGSPKDEEPEALHPQETTKSTNGKQSDVEAKPDKSNTTACKESKKSANDEPKRNGVSENGHCGTKSECESETESSQVKRFRDQDENEPSSPSKKCRPENKTKNSSKAQEDSAKNGVEDSESASSYNSSKNGPGKSFDKRPKNSLNGDAQGGPKNGVGDEKGRQKNGKTEKGEKRTGKDVKHKGELLHDDTDNGKTQSKDSSSSVSASSLSSDTDSSDGEADGTERWVERTKESIGKARANPSAQVVHWNGNLKDLSHTLSRDGKGEAQEEEGTTAPQKRKGAMWDGSRSTEVVDELRRAGGLPYGTKVGTWAGGLSAIDQEADKERRDAKKRSAQDLYNEEFDSGRTKKMKYKKNSSWERPSWESRGNDFQRVQDQRNFGNWTPHHHNHHHNNSYYNNNSSNGYQQQPPRNSPHYNNNTNGNHNRNHNSPYYRNNQQQQHWNKNGNYRYNNNNTNTNGDSNSSKPWKQWNSNKPWSGNNNNKFGKPNFHKKHKDKFKRYDNRF